MIVWIVKRIEYRHDHIEKAFSDRESAEKYVASEYPNAELSKEADRETLYDRGGSMQGILVRGMEVEDDE